MAEATRTVEMNVPMDKLWSVIVDYERYPEFVDGAEKVKILSRDGIKARVEYSISLLGKDITYVLDHIEEKKGQMHWDFVESNILKSNAGAWELEDLGNGKTRATYKLELDFKIYVPGMILNGLVKSSLPKMLENFEKRTLSLGK